MSQQQPAAVPAAHRPIVSLDGKAILSIDHDDFSFYLDCRPGCRPSTLKDMFELAEGAYGLAPLDPDEDDEPEYLEDGTIRIWMRPAVPVPDLARPVPSTRAAR